MPTRNASFVLSRAYSLPGDPFNLANIAFKVTAVVHETVHARARERWIAAVALG